LYREAGYYRVDEEEKEVALLSERALEELR
jgi:hypothetical protein